MAFVEFRDVRKVYTMGEVKVAAVDGMTFDIEQGELVVVVGPSGIRQNHAAQHAWWYGLVHVRLHQARWARNQPVQREGAHRLSPLRHRLRFSVLQPGAKSYRA